MKRLLPVVALSGLILGAHYSHAEATNKVVTPPAPEVKAPANPTVVIETSLGTITAELWQDQTPGTVKNFLNYTDKKFYDGTIFHRVIPNFMIQGGGFTPDMKQKRTDAPIKNEAKSENKNLRGTLAMARTPQVNSATSQFFINLVDNAPLNHKNESASGFGYCVFGKVIEGMDVVDAIAKVSTGMRPPHRDVPVENVVIEGITRKVAMP